MYFVGFDITNKQREIVYLVYKFRFINRIQLQKILGHKDARRLNAWLKDLVAKGYLGRIYSKKLPENTKPAIYFLSNLGIALIRQKNQLTIPQVKKFYDDKKASQTFITHCLTLCSIYIHFTQKFKRSSFTTKTELWLESDFEELKPDAYLTNTNEKTQITSHFFLDIINPQVPRYALRGRINQFIELYNSYEYEHKKFPPVLLILPDETLRRYAKKYILKQFEEQYYLDRLAFSLTTATEILTKGFEPDVWVSCIAHGGE